MTPPWKSPSDNIVVSGLGCFVSLLFLAAGAFITWLLARNSPWSTSFTMMFAYAIGWTARSASGLSRKIAELFKKEGES